jgi:hypothetical protein
VDVEYAGRAFDHLFQGIQPPVPPTEADPATIDHVVTIAFALWLRNVVGDGGDAAIRTLSGEYPLFDLDGVQIPSWMVEGIVRAALGDVTMAQGIAPETRADVQIGLIARFAETAPLAEEQRRALVDAGVDALAEINRRQQEPTQPPPQ